MDHQLSQIHAVLSTTAPRWVNLADTVPADLLARPPADGEWSAVDCLRHLLDTERFVFPVRLRAILAGQDFAAFDPDSEGTTYAGQTPPQLAADFAQRRAESLAAFAQVTGADLSRTARHAKLGLVTLGQLLHEWAAHDLNHTIQAERSLMQPFVEACGPWRSYFQDHDYILSAPLD